MRATVHRTEDFELDGHGTAAGWATAEWVDVPPVDGRPGHATRAALLYSATGIYGRFTCDDGRLSCTDLADGDDLWTEDVVEAFFWPDERQRLYLEYEISPLGRELTLLVPNHGGAFMGWAPWHYRGDRRVRRATSVTGGPTAAGAAVTGWAAEFFVPFALLVGLGNVPPAAGTRWRANLCRVDHDDGSARLYSWATGTGGSFHAIEAYPTLVFA